MREKNPGGKMKRKILGLTMQVTKVYDDKHHFTHTEYTFINPVVTNVLNCIMSELASKYAMVVNQTEDKELGNLDIHTGKIICRNWEQEIEYFHATYGHAV